MTFGRCRFAGSFAAADPAAAAAAAAADLAEAATNTIGREDRTRISNALGLCLTETFKQTLSVIPLILVETGTNEIFG